MLTYKNSIFTFYHFNNYLSQINEAKKLIHNTIISEDALALGAGKNLTAFYRATAKSDSSTRG